MLKATFVLAALIIAAVTVAVTANRAPAEDNPVIPQWIIYANVPHASGKTSHHEYSSDNVAIDRFVTKDECETVLGSAKLAAAQQGMLLAVLAHEGPEVAKAVTFTCELGGFPV